MGTDSQILCMELFGIISYSLCIYLLLKDLKVPNADIFHLNSIYTIIWNHLTRFNTEMNDGEITITQKNN